MGWLARMMAAIRRTPATPDPAKARVERRLEAVEQRLRRLVTAQEWERLYRERLNDRVTE